MTSSTFQVLILGDFHYGESYRQAGARILANHGYEHSSQHLRPFLDSVDYVVANLETPIINPTDFKSPLLGMKRYIHWADPHKTPEALRELGVHAVSLANNHTLDYGPEGLFSTFDALSRVQIPWFGAGQNIEDATRPHVIQLPKTAGSGEIHIHGGLQYSAHLERLGFYATDHSPGCARLNPPSPVPSSQVSREADHLKIAFPHWGSNYRWRSDSQGRLADAILNEPYDLILGHGSHSIQEIERRRSRWVVHSIGNGLFQSGGRFKEHAQSHQILPMGFWAILAISTHKSDRNVQLRLYPVYADNRATNFQPHPVNRTDFSDIEQLLYRTKTTIGLEFGPSLSTGSDHLGYYLRLDLGAWPIGQSVQPLDHHSEPRASNVATPGMYDDTDSLLIRRRQASAGRNVAPLLISRAAELDGATTKWLDPRIAVVSTANRRVLLQGHRGGESAVGRAIIGDKFLSKQLLLQAGITTPLGDLARTPADAIAFQKRLDRPIVIKPRYGQKQRGVSINLLDEEEIHLAFEAAGASGEVVVEEYIEAASEYRCLTSPNECVSAVRRILPHVIGDGSSTILELIQVKNSQRMLNPSTFNRPIPLDSTTTAYLAQQRLDYSSVPTVGTVVTVRGIGGLSTGGEPEEVSDWVDPAVKQLAVRAVAALPGLAWGGVDVLVSKATGEPYIIEINSDADIAGASFPYYGTAVDVAQHIWQMRLAQASPDDTSLSPQRPQLPEHSKPAFTAPGTPEDRRLSNILLKTLTSKGYTTLRHSDTVTQVVDAKGLSHWLYRTQSVNDLAATSDVMSKHRIVRRALRMAGLTLPRATRVRDLAGFWEFVANTSSKNLAMLPFRQAWRGPHFKSGGPTNILSSITDGQGSWLLQVRPRGVRLRIIATRYEVLTIVGRNPASQTIIDTAATVAVDSVRAVPGLNWACVDIVVQDVDSDGSRTYVEGMTLDPRFSRHALILAGSLEGASEAIFSLSTPQEGSSHSSMEVSRGAVGIRDAHDN